MKRLLIAGCAVLLAGAPAMADDASKGPEMVLLPANVAALMRNWIAEPNPMNAVMLFAKLDACLSNNGTSITRVGPDQCPEVTKAIEARKREIDDLKKKLADAEEKVTPEAPPKGG